MSKLRNSAKGQVCMVRVPGVCSGQADQTVLAHMNGYGIGGKRLDLHGAFACYECHKHIDSHYDEFTVRMFLDGVIRTQEWWVRAGLLVLP